MRPIGFATSVPPTNAGDAAALVAVMQEMARKRLNVGTSGNASVRTRDGFLVTPSAIPPDTLRPQSICRMGMDGTVKRGKNPSSEWRLHRDILELRGDCCAVVHAHPERATSLACLGRGIPAFHYLVAAAGGPDIPCTGYAPFGSAELSKLATGALRGRDACLLGNHGLVTVGPTLREALDLAALVEELAGLYLGCLSAGTPRILSDLEMKDALDRYAAYRRGDSAEITES